MAKLKLIRLYKVDDVPDHIVQEVCDVVNKLGKHLSKACEGHEQNIILSAFARFHAGMICSLVSENDLENAAKTEAIGLIKNIEHMSGKTILSSDED
jgi:hypothetical protein